MQQSRAGLFFAHSFIGLCHKISSFLYLPVRALYLLARVLYLLMAVIHYLPAIFQQLIGSRMNSIIYPCIGLHWIDKKGNRDL